MRRSLLDLNNQIELLRADNAKLRGRTSSCRATWPKCSASSATSSRAWTTACARSSRRRSSSTARNSSPTPRRSASTTTRWRCCARASSTPPAWRVDLLRRYPASGYRESALFWLGNAQYGKRDYKEAIASFRAFVTAAPDNPSAPEALLAIANCQTELKDAKAARRTIDELIKTYPKSEAAQAGKERLAR